VFFEELFIGIGTWADAAEKDRGDEGTV